MRLPAYGTQKPSSGRKIFVKIPIDFQSHALPNVVHIKNIWTYVSKTLPILASVAFSFSSFSPLNHRSSSRLQIYDTPYPALLFTPKVTISPHFLGYASKDLPHLPQTMVRLG